MFQQIYKNRYKVGKPESSSMLVSQFLYVMKEKLKVIIKLITVQPSVSSNYDTMNEYIRNVKLGMNK